MKKEKHQIVIKLISKNIKYRLESSGNIYIYKCNKCETTSE